MTDYLLAAFVISVSAVLIAVLWALALESQDRIDWAAKVIGVACSIAGVTGIVMLIRPQWDDE